MANEVMDLFEKVELKDQKLISAQTTTKPEFKQNYLAPLRCLDPQDQCFLLTRCKNKDLSLAEMKKEASVLKKMAVLKKAFVKLTNSKNWEDASSQFPLFACESQLKKFTAIDFSKELPQSFVSFCKRVKSSMQTGVAIDDNQAMVKYGEAAAYAIKGTISELSSHSITCSYSGFHGADLILLSLTQV